MDELRIDSISVEIDGASGHEHRIGPIVERAVTLAAERLSKSPAAPPQSIDTVAVPGIDIDLNRLGDDQAAQTLADAFAQAIVFRLKVQ